MCGRSGWEGQGGGVGGAKVGGRRVCGSNMGEARMRKGEVGVRGEGRRQMGREM